MKTIRTYIQLLIVTITLYSNTSMATLMDVLTHDNTALMYSTGVNLNGNVDNSYVLNTYNGSPLSAEMRTTSASWLAGNTNTSQWISHIGNTHVGSLTLSAVTSLDLTGIDLINNDFSLLGYWLSDNQGLDILVNGISTGQTNTGRHRHQPSAHEGNIFQISSTMSSLVAGMNEIEFVWGNNEAGNAPFCCASPVGLRVEMDSFQITSKGIVSAAVPEPTSIAMFMVGVFGLLVSRQYRVQY